MTGKTELPEIVEPPCWRMSPVDLSEFLRRLSEFAPRDSILYLEGGCAPDIEAYLLERPATYENRTNQGFLKLRPKIFYMPITSENLQGLAALSERHAEPEVANSLGVYSNGKILLSWHDLPFDPLYVSSEIAETDLIKFCSILRCEYVMEVAHL